MNVSPDDVSFVINTHSHSDHIGNNNLFLKAKHIVGQSISYRDLYELHDLKDPYIIEDGIEVISTRGHTLGCVSVIVCNGICNGTEGVIGIVGDLFEREADIDDDTIWKEAGSEDECSQIRNRSAIADVVDYILPGHGPGFKVTEDIRIKLRAKLSEKINKTDETYDCVSIVSKFLYGIHRWKNNKLVEDNITIHHQSQILQLEDQKLVISNCKENIIKQKTNT